MSSAFDAAGHEKRDPSQTNRHLRAENVPTWSIYIGTNLQGVCEIKLDPADSFHFEYNVHWTVGTRVLEENDSLHFPVSPRYFSNFLLRGSAGLALACGERTCMFVNRYKSILSWGVYTPPYHPASQQPKAHTKKERTTVTMTEAQTISLSS